MKVTFFKSASEFRTWLEENHESTQELWVGFYRKDSGKAGITYPEALDEALCYGWIDGIRKSIDEISYTNRFTPRKKRSNWSLVNIKRVAELTKSSHMKPPGLKAFQQRAQDSSGNYSYEASNHKLDEISDQKFRANKKAWDFFQAQAPWYQRTASRWVISAKKEETRLRRLAQLIDDSKNGRRLSMFSKPQK